MAAPRGVGGGGAGLCILCMRVGRLVAAGNGGAAAAGWEEVGVVAEGRVRRGEAVAFLCRVFVSRAVPAACAWLRGWFGGRRTYSPFLTEAVSITCGGFVLVARIVAS